MERKRELLRLDVARFWTIDVYRAAYSEVDAHAGFYGGFCFVFGFCGLEEEEELLTQAYHLK